MARGKYIVIFHAIESGWCCGIKYSNLGQAKKRLNNWISNLGNKLDYCFGIIGEEAFDYKRRIDSDIMYRFEESEPCPADAKCGAVREYKWYNYPFEGDGIHQLSTCNVFPSIDRAAKIGGLSATDMREKLKSVSDVYCGEWCLNEFEE